MEHTAFFLDKQFNQLKPPFAFSLDARSMALVFSALGYDITEDEPLQVEDVLYSINLYERSDLAAVIDTGRADILQQGGQVEGVQFSNKMTMHFPAMAKGFLSDKIDLLKRLCEESLDFGAIYVLPQ